MKKILLITIVLLSLTGCSEEAKTIKIAEQYGIAYAPLQVMKEEQILESLLGDDYEVKWVKLANTAAIREAMIGDDLDIGFTGIPPFIIGVDNGMDWQIISALSESPLGLVVNDPNIKELSDLLDQGKIALPQPGSIQHILLSMSAKEELGDATIFDNQLVSMKHPDGQIALNAGKDIKAHYTSPPFIFQELDQENNHLLVDGIDAMNGEFTFIVGVCGVDFYEQSEEYRLFKEALEMAIERINSGDDSVIELLAESYSLDYDTMDAYLNHQDMSYGNEIKGVQTFIDFMFEAGYIKEELFQSDVIWD